MSKKIPLTKGYAAILDDRDYSLVTSYGGWHVQVKPNGKKYAIGFFRREGRNSTRRMHRVILGAKEGQIVDHINGDGLDNRRENLRITDSVGNARNRNVSNKSGYKGVRKLYVNKRGVETWVARICLAERKTQVIGYYTTAKEAALAYDREAKKHFGSFAFLNFPE